MIFNSFYEKRSHKICRYKSFLACHNYKSSSLVLIFDYSTFIHYNIFSQKSALRFITTNIAKSHLYVAGNVHCRKRHFYLTKKWFELYSTIFLGLMIQPIILWRDHVGDGHHEQIFFLCAFSCRRSGGTALKRKVTSCSYAWVARDERTRTRVMCIKWKQYGACGGHIVTKRKLRRFAYRPIKVVATFKCVSGINQG